MRTIISDVLGTVRNALAHSAVVTAAGTVLAFLLVPIQTQIIDEKGIPAQLMTVGKKGNPKAVYVTTKKRNINPVPAIFSIAAAIAAAVIKFKYDKKSR